MKLNKRLKKNGDNPYSRATGFRAHTLKGGTGCTVSAYDSVFGNKHKVQPYAYYIFNIKPICGTFNKYIKVTSSCGATNCVNLDHLIAVYSPTKKDQQYIKDYLHIDGIENMAHRLNIPVSLLEQYLTTSK